MPFPPGPPKIHFLNGSTYSIGVARGGGARAPPNQNSTNDKKLWQHSLTMFSSSFFSVIAHIPVINLNFGEDLFFFFGDHMNLGGKIVRISDFGWKITLNFGEDSRIFEGLAPPNQKSWLRLWPTVPVFYDIRRYLTDKYFGIVWGCHTPGTPQMDPPKINFLNSSTWVPMFYDIRRYLTDDYFDSTFLEVP